MSLICRFSGHATGAVLQNQGFAFSRCRRCNRDLLKSQASSDRGWRTIPAGFRVSWRDADVAICASPSAAEWVAATAGRARGSVMALAARLGGGARQGWEMAARRPAAVKRRVSFALSGAARMVAALAMVLRWMVGDIGSRLRSGLRLRAARSSSNVIHLGGLPMGLASAGNENWRFVINLNVRAHAAGDGLRGQQGSAWIGKLVEI